ncbi:hypothetical protein RchiOBHm_Chr6g0270551 [Rosa chinensis]|uniref:Uncharacterized protein n=1 Tax=Rosa chinensis TaxID=74649 RepID=A0A2P6PQR1_ROSCH|nr:hypothetical protein RchiOBHm_Chr6g0270551 [Rosa chinensis]
MRSRPLFFYKSSSAVPQISSYSLTPTHPITHSPPIYSLSSLTQTSSIFQDLRFLGIRERV